MNVNDVDRIVADSTLAADIVLPHPSKYQRIFIFVENGGMITSGWRKVKFFDPGIAAEWVDVSGWEGMAAVPSDHYCILLEYDSGVTFSCWDGRWV